MELESAERLLHLKVEENERLWRLEDEEHERQHQHETDMLTLRGIEVMGMGTTESQKQQRSVHFFHICRSCLVKYLEENNTCPTCRIVIHQSHPLQYIGHDRTMQDIVYKLVPGLQEEEMRKQREFYQKLGMEVPGDIKGETCSAKQHLDAHRNGETKTDENSNKETTEDKQEEDHDYHRSDEQVSICLECNSSKLRGLKRKWIRCSAQATVLHLKKFIAKKLNLTSFNELDILCNEEILGKDHTLKFVVVTRWRFKKSPLLLHYRPKMDLL
ncbi:polycomb group RING finger protein 3 [Protopterus annectens]|uniref:polycomb group RING finger protein 3 n=1 Tax=Protopterus annectens TaxID=7888 RepID=UPI001CF99FB2|nr:polycomb group RING finger protein 3 [Protopterus annectens]